MALIDVLRYRSGVFGTMFQIVRESGPASLFRGITPSLCGIVPYVGIDFAVYDTLRELIPKRPHSDEPTIEGKLMAGAAAGTCGQTVAYPLDTVRRLLQVQDVKVKRDGVRYSGMVDCFVRVVQRDGIRGLYRGLLANYLKVIPSVAISFTVFEMVEAELGRLFP